jgi:hypothetical protein
VLAAIAAVLWLTRWPLAPKYLYHFDSVNFALALEKYEPLWHRPQPPGYPLLVGLMRVLHWFLPQAEQVLLWAGVVGGALAVWLLWWFGETLYGPRVGFVAALLLLFNPALWRAGAITQARTFLAMVSVAVAFMAWRVWQGNGGRKWFYVFSLLFGLAAGFRPALCVLLLPLWLGSGIRSKRTMRDLLVGAVLFAAGILSWFGYLLYAVGGPAQFYEWLRLYVPVQFRDTRFQMGGFWRMAWAAVVWNGLGALGWIWAVPFRLRRLAASDWRSAPFLALWFVPGFLFQALVHIGDADQALATIPVLCLLGGRVLSGCALPFWAAAAAVNALVFFQVDQGLAGRSAYGNVAHFNRTVTPALDALRELRSQGPIFIISYPSSVSWRHLSFYFPEDPLLFFHGDLRRKQDRSDAWMIRRELERVIEPGEEIELPAKGKIVFLSTEWADHDLVRGAPFRTYGTLLYLDSRPSMSFQIGGWRLKTRALPGGK